MNITPINTLNTKNQRTPFKGKFYMDANSNDVTILREALVPLIKGKMNDEVSAFVGTNPFWSILDDVINKICELNKAPREWLIMNADIHGVKIPKPQMTNKLWVITGTKDNNLFEKYVRQRIAPKKTFLNRIKSFFMHDDSYENYPKHLRNLAKFLDMAKAEDKAFEVFVKNNNFKKAANMNDLAEKILIDHLERNLHF